MNPEMFAREYGTTYGRFAETCKVLLNEGELVHSGPNDSLLKSFRVREPMHYDPNDDHLGQRPLERRWILDYSSYDPNEWTYRKLTPDEMADAIDLLDQVADEALDALDELDQEEE